MLRNAAFPKDSDDDDDNHNRLLNTVDELHCYHNLKYSSDSIDSIRNNLRIGWAVELAVFSFNAIIIIWKSQTLVHISCKQTKKNPSRPTSPRQLCVCVCIHCMPSLNTKNRRLFVLNERMREKKKCWEREGKKEHGRERCSTCRFSLNYTVDSFVLSRFFSLLVLWKWN